VEQSRNVGDEPAEQISDRSTDVIGKRHHTLPSLG
jgi:hypothetical protein